MGAPAGSNRRIVLYGSPLLRQRCLLVKTLDHDVRRLLADLKTTILAQDGLGLAANQIGESLLVFAVNPRAADIDEEPYCIINPELVATEGAVEREEGCLSIPGVYDVVTRPGLVRIRGLNEAGAPVEVEATGMLARTLSHELDHLSGVLFIDRLGPTRRKLLASRLEEIAARETRLCG